MGDWGCGTLIRIESNVTVAGETVTEIAAVRTEECSETPGILWDTARSDTVLRQTTFGATVMTLKDARSTSQR